MKKILSILFILIGVNSFAQLSTIEFVENKGQWNKNIQFKAKIPSGNLYLEENELTYQFYNEQDKVRFDDLHHGSIKNPTPQDYLMNLHAFKVEFLNSNTSNIVGTEASSGYENYFIGNDKTKWASNVKKYHQTAYHNIYNNIDLKFYLRDAFLKYDFVVKKGGNTNDIQFNYKGVDGIVLEKGTIKITTSVNEIIEQKPYAYQIINGKQKEVKCKFKLEGSVVSFDFPKGYNKKYELKDKDERRKNNLNIRLEKAKIDDAAALLNSRSGGDSDGIHFEITIGTASNQTAITSGKLIKKWTKNNRNYFHYKTQQSIINF